MESMPIGTASVSWVENGQVNLRVYSTDGYTVTERCNSGGAWTNGGLSEAGSAVSATCWQDSGGVHIRVYCTFQDATIEWCSDNGGNWTKGDYTVE